MLRFFALLALAASMSGFCQGLQAEHFYVLVVFNEGVLSEHRSCSDEDFILIRDTVADLIPQRRQLSAERRELQTYNCARLCCPYAWGTCTVAGCQGWLISPSRCNDYRRLDEDVPIPGFKFVNPEDPIWYEDGDRRALQQTLTIEQCNAKRVEIYQHLLSTLPDVATRCNNFLLSPINMQCVVAVTDGV